MKAKQEEDIDILFYTEHDQPKTGLLQNVNISESKRDQWNNDLEYFMSVLGYAVGYGSLWRFPYVMYKNGGGTFLIPYCIFVVLIAGPVFIFETGLGQIYQKSLPMILEQRIHKKWKGVGIWAILVALVMSSYYNYIQCFSLQYLYLSMYSPLAWTVSTQQEQNIFQTANDYLLHSLLKVSNNINQYGEFNPTLYLWYVVSMVMVYLAIVKGPTASGRVAMFTATVPYLLLVIMMLNGFTLKGSLQGLVYLFQPDLSLLSKPSIWVDAMVQVSFQYSCGMGVLVSFGSYRQKGQSLVKACWGLIIGTFLCGLLGGVIVFQYLGHLSYLTSTPISALPLQGPQLAFVAYPCALSMIPLANLFSGVFFFMMVLLGIDTQMGLCECVCGFVEDHFGHQLMLSRLAGCKWLANRAVMVNKALVLMFICCFGCIYCSGAGLYLLEHVDAFNATIGIVGQLLFEILLVVQHSKFYTDFKLDVLELTKQEIPFFVDKSLKYIIPPILTIFLICGIINLFMTSLTFSIQVFLFMWFLVLFPIFIAFKIWSNNKRIIQIITAGENELVDIQYYKPQVSAKKTQYV